MNAVKNEALDVAVVVAQYQREVEALKAQLAALTGNQSMPKAGLGVHACMHACMLWCLIKQCCSGV